MSLNGTGMSEHVSLTRSCTLKGRWGWVIGEVTDEMVGTMLLWGPGYCRLTVCAGIGVPMV